MDTQAAISFTQAITLVISDMARAVCERDGETRQQQNDRSQAAVHMAMAFLPRDLVEAMLAGRCVMFHALMMESISDTLRGEVDSKRRAVRGSIVAMDKAFGNNLTRLEKYQTRPSHGRRDVPEARANDGSAEAHLAVQSDAAARPRGGPGNDADVMAAEFVGHSGSMGSPDDALPARNNATPPHMPAGRTVETPAEVLSQPSSPSLSANRVDYTPLPSEIAECVANVDAIAALNRGDAAGFARARGIEAPSAEYLAAAAVPGSVFDRLARVNRAMQPRKEQRSDRDTSGDGTLTKAVASR